MTIRFPNQSRSYVAGRRAVRFWGYDSAMEASFYVSEEALKLIQPDVALDEADMLDAFDANRNKIYGVATKVYGRGPKGNYDLVPKDF